MDSRRFTIIYEAKKERRRRRSDTMRPITADGLEQLSEAMGVAMPTRELGVSMPATVIYNDGEREPRDAV